MTKYLGEQRVIELLGYLTMDFRGGRADTASQLYSAEVDSKRGCLGDLWVNRGENGQWSRHHTTFRRALFTLFKLSKGPNGGDRIASCRHTVGTFV